MSKPTDDELRLRQRNLAWREVEGEIVSLDSAGSNYLAANRSGAVLWKALADGATLADLVTLLTATFAIEESVARRDVEAFVGELEAHDLLERGSS